MKRPDCQKCVDKVEEEAIVHLTHKNREASRSIETMCPQGRGAGALTHGWSRGARDALSKNFKMLHLQPGIPHSNHDALSTLSISYEIRGGFDM